MKYHISVKNFLIYIQFFATFRYTMLRLHNCWMSVIYNTAIMTHQPGAVYLTYFINSGFTLDCTSCTYSKIPILAPLKST